MDEWNVEFANKEGSEHAVGREKIEPISAKTSPVCTKVGEASGCCDNNEARSCAPRVPDVKAVW